MNKKTIDKLNDLLPGWAIFVADENGRELILIDPNKCYPSYLEELKKVDDTCEANCYWVQLARRCATFDLHDIVGPGITIRWVSEPILDDEGKSTGKKSGDAWALKNLPEREGDEPGMGDLWGSGQMANYIYTQLKKVRASLK